MTTQDPNILTAALDLQAAGISVLPVAADGTKRPAGKWKQYQTGRATEQEIRSWFPTGTTLGVGIVTGTISGNLELAEIEGAHAHRVPELTELAEASGLGDLWHRVSSGWLELSPSGGWHWFYRVQPEQGWTMPGNTKLAKAADRTVIAETRSEGGYVVAAPTTGMVHPTGRAWVRIAGGPSTIPTLTVDEREAFLGLLATLTEAQPQPAEQPALAVPAAPRGSIEDGTTPGDDYEARTTWDEILKPHGWAFVYKDHSGTSYWRRPGKNIGISATTGHKGDRDRLFVFTSSTQFQQEVPYTKFGAYALLAHNGNHSAAASALRKAGHGSEPHISTELPAAWANALGTHQHASAARPAPAAPAALASVPARQQPPTITTPLTEGTAALAPVTNLDDHRAAVKTLARSDDGHALALIHEHGNTIRFCAERGRWLHWTGSRWEWQPKGGGVARELAKDVARRLPENNDTEARHKKSALSAVGITNTLAQAQTDHRMVVSIDDLDAHPWELNTPGGILDLRTGTLTPSDPAKLHTMITAVTPDPDANPALWDDFIRTTFPDDEIAAYMQRLAGYSAVGKVEAHILPFCYGHGGNGKGVFLEALRSVLGDYATSAPANFLMANPLQQHSTEIARLAGRRFVICSEVDERARFDESKVKLLTGGDALTARFMRQDDFTFTPTHSLWLMGNHQPAVDSGGNSFWRRLRLIPFEHTVPEEKRIDDLQGILATDHGPAVLAWIAAGAAAYATEGLREPQQVKAATTAYASSTDTVGRFLADECITGPDAVHMSAPVATLRAAYEAWCRAEGERPVTGRAFPSQLERHGVTTGRNAPRTGHQRLYGRVGLIASQDAADEHDGDRGGY